MKLPAIRQLPSGHWFCQLRIDGKSISITEPTRDKCYARAVAMKTGILSAKDQPQGITLGAACDAYIASRVGIRSPTTIDSYKKIRNQYFQSIMGTRLPALTARMISLAVQREAARTSRRGTPLSPKTIRSALGFIMSVLNEYGVNVGSVVFPEPKRKLVKIPSPEQIIPVLIGTDIELPCLLAAWLSLSMSEIRGLTKSRSLVGNQLFVTHTTVRVKTSEYTGKDGKKHGVYSDITKEGGKEEERTRCFTLPSYLKNLIDVVDGDVIVPMSIRQIERRFDNLLKSNNLPHMTFHQLRHLNASAMAMLNIQKEIAQERGGWKTPYTMDQVYTHTFTQPRLDADAKINTYFESLLTRNANENANKRKKYRIYKRFKR